MFRKLRQIINDDNTCQTTMQGGTQTNEEGLTYLWASSNVSPINRVHHRCCENAWELRETIVEQ